MNHETGVAGADPGAGRGEWRAGWKVLGAAMVCYICSTMPLTVLGALVKPLSAEFGWSRASITSAFLITAIGTLFLAPVVGALVDRIGPRRVALFGLPVMALGPIAISMAGPSIWSWYACWAIHAFCQAWAGNVIWANVVIGRFDRNRGMALAVLLSAHALTYGMLPAFGVFTVAELGWRWVFYLLAAFVLLIAWPIAWRFIYGVNDRRVGEAAPVSKVVAHATPAGSLADVLKTPVFWQIAIAFALAALVIAGLFVHFQVVLIDRGMTPMQAAGVAVVLGPASLIGRLGTGWILDRFSANRVAAVALILPGISYLMLLLGEDWLLGAYLAGFFLGLAGAAESDLMAYLVSRYFGPRMFGKVYGFLLGLYAIGFGVGPILAGNVYDRIGSYEPIFIVLSVAALAGSLLILALGPPGEQKA
jgi:predicted MFS family arabinose efflux permease